MKLEYFHYLVEIERQRSISAAAKKLYLGQTTLSAVVKSVEKEFGFEIFQRTPKGVFPTAVGSEFLHYAEDILVKYDELLRLKDKGQGISYPATLLISSTFSVALPLAISERIEKEAPDSSLTFDSYPRFEVFSRLLANEANVGITHLHKSEIPTLQKQAGKNNLVIESLRDDYFYLCISHDHELASRSSINPATMPPVSVASVKGFYKLGEVESLFAGTEKQAISYTVFPNIESVCQSIQHQNKAALFTGYLVATQIDTSQIAAIPVEEMDNIRGIDICLIHRYSKNLTFLEKLLVENLRDYFNQIDLPKPNSIPL